MKKYERLLLVLTEKEKLLLYIKILKKMETLDLKIKSREEIIEYSDLKLILKDLEKYTYN